MLDFPFFLDMSAVEGKEKKTELGVTKNWEKKEDEKYPSLPLHNLPPVHGWSKLNDICSSVILKHLNFQPAVG